MLRSLGNTAGHRQPLLPKEDPRTPFLVRFARSARFLLAIALLGGSSLPGAAASSHASDNVPAQKPEASIPVAPLGYGAPGALYLLSGMAFNSLDFLDSSHLLFTFHESRLLRRDEATVSSKDDDDQLIRAVVLRLPAGTISATADWRLHDRNRYLWPLSGGRFLLRQRDAYSIADASLQLHRWLVSPTRVEATEVSPEGTLVLIESDGDQAHSQESSGLHTSVELDDAPAPRSTLISLLDVDTKEMRAAFQVELPIQLPVTSTGYLAAGQRKPEEYVLRFVPFHGHPVTLGEVNSTCRPLETFLNANAVMIESCGPSTSDVYLDTWTIDGKKLWSGRREGHMVWPTFATAQNGSRFAVGMLQVAHEINLLDSLDDENVKQQMVQVFDTNTGELLLTTDASPILAQGQNFALSPDGNHLAVLRHGSVEIYEVPAHSTAPGKDSSKSEDSTKSKTARKK